MSANRSIGVIAAHPDDEILGCGATIAKHVAQGDRVHVLIMAEGLTSRDNERQRARHQAELNELAQAAQRANDIIGVQSLKLLDFPDNRMDGIELLDVVKAIEAFIGEYRCERIYTHHAMDVNIDHRIVHHAVLTACRPVPGQCVRELLCFEVPSSTEWQSPLGQTFSPNWYEDVSDFYSKKYEALQHYEMEMRSWPHSRSIKAVECLARWRGANVGCDYAEAFELVRCIAV